MHTLHLIAYIKSEPRNGSVSNRDLSVVRMCTSQMELDIFSLYLYHYYILKTPQVLTPNNGKKIFC